MLRLKRFCFLLWTISALLAQVVVVDLKAQVFIHDSRWDNDFLSPSIFYGLLSSDSTGNFQIPEFTYTTFDVSGGFAWNYQYRNSYTDRDFYLVGISGQVHKGFFQFNARSVYGQEWNAETPRTIIRSSFQAGAYIPLDEGEAVPLRLVALYNHEYHSDSIAYHELGIDYSGDFVTSLIDQGSNGSGFYGGYFLSWRLNTKDFYYGWAYLFELPIMFKIMQPNLTLGIYRNRVEKIDRWGNFKAGVGFDVRGRSTSGIRFYYNFVRDIPRNKNWNEIGIMTPLRLFSAFNFMDSSEKNNGH